MLLDVARGDSKGVHRRTTGMIHLCLGSTQSRCQQTDLMLVLQPVVLAADVEEVAMVQ